MVELKLSYEALTIINATLQGIYRTKGHTRREKSTLSIALDVVKIFDKHNTKLKAITDLFASKKHVKVKLKFHEADMLELLLIQEIKFVTASYICLQIQNTINDLNQKLA